MFHTFPRSVTCIDLLQWTENSYCRHCLPSSRIRHAVITDSRNYKIWHLVVSWRHSSAPRNSSLWFNNINVYKGLSKWMRILVEYIRVCLNYINKIKLNMYSIWHKYVYFTIIILLLATSLGLKGHHQTNI